jgi:hypothetical protein
MAKLETPAAVSAALRPPRPAVRMRPGIDAPEHEGDPGGFAPEGFVAGDVDTGADAARRFAGRAHAGPEVMEVLELDDDEVVAEPADGDAAFDPPMSEEAVTERGFDASTFGLPRAGGTRLPMANLEMPSSSRLELTPSPVPRVALSPATGAVDISLVPGPHASRNLPTLAAYHALGRRPLRRPASAITFPPPRRASADSPRLGAGLAKDVRSSKREIVLGLAIGLGLSLVLAAVGQAYLHEEPIAGSPPEVQALALSARPQTAASAPEAAPFAEPRAGSEPSAEPASAGAEGALATAASVTERSLARANELQRSASPGRVGPSAARASEPRGSVPPRAVARRSHARHDAAPGGARASSAFEPGPAYDAPLPARAALPSTGGAAASPVPMSPAESAGLGLDLPL